MKNSIVKRLAKLQALYNRLPVVACKGLCHRHCAAVPMFALEIKALERTTDRTFLSSTHLAGRQLPPNTTVISTSLFDLGCPVLVDNRCSAYESRPLICRLFGVAEGLSCPYGCEPEVELSLDQVGRLLEEVAKI